MVQQISPQDQEQLYPDSDGKPMADNTQQYRWIVLIKENLEILWTAIPDVFIAADLLWYPLQVPKPPAPSQAPDVMVVFGRPKGERRSYRQWEENDIPPQVVWEILSESNKTATGQREMKRKLVFYQQYGVEEYYIYDPEEVKLEGWQRQGSKLVPIASMSDWVSPRLQIRFAWQEGEELVLYRPDGGKFLSSVELEEQLLRQKQRADQEQQRADQEQQRADQAEAAMKALLERLRERGINPDQL